MLDEQVIVGSKDDAENVLGTVWTPREDKLSLKIKTECSADPAISRSPPDPPKLTKRTILSKLAAIYDPVGFAAAVVITLKIALQELWQLGFDWDDKVPTAIRQKWMSLLGEVVKLNNVKFDRSLTPAEVVGKPCLIVFCDSSRLRSEP